MSKIDLKQMQNSGIGNILEQHYSKSILYRFLIFVVKDTRATYDCKNHSEVYDSQNKVLKILGDLLLGKEVSSKDIRTAANAPNAAAYAATTAANAVYAAVYAADAVYAAVYAANAVYAAAYAADAAYAAKQQEYKNYLIKLVLEENGINTKTYGMLYI